MMGLAVKLFTPAGTLIASSFWRADFQFLRRRTAKLVRGG